MRSLVSYLEETADRDPDRVLYTFRNVSGEITNSLTFGQFHRRTDSLACQLTDAGYIRSGEPALLVYPPGLEFGAAFFACAKAGALPVPVPPPGRTGMGGDLERLEHIARDCGAGVALSERKLIHRFERLQDRDDAAGAPLLKGALQTVHWIDTPALENVTADFHSTPSRCLFLQYTSGSTENPRGVMVTHDNIVHNCGIALDFKPDQLPIGVSWLPHYHDMGLIGFYLFAVITGGTAHLFSPLDFLRRPLLWPEIASQVRATITSAPNFAMEYCLREDKLPSDSLAGVDLSALESLLNGAEPVRHETVTRFLRKFEPHGLKRNAVKAGYGLAEHTLCVTKGVPAPLDLNIRDLERHRVRPGADASAGSHQRTIVSCGKPASDVDVRIVDPDSRTILPEHSIGEIWVKSASKAAGYWNRTALSADVFDASISGDDTEIGFLRTGDMGFMHRQELYVCGRRKDLVVVRGQNIYPTDIEALVERQFKEIEPGSVVAFGVDQNSGDGEALIVIVEGLRNSPEQLLHAFQREIRVHAMVSANTLAVVPKGSITRTSSGKPRRSDCRARWIAGDIKPVASISILESDTASANERFVDDILSRLDGLADSEQALESAGLDSLDLVTLNLYLEQGISAALPDTAGLSESFKDLKLLQSMSIDEMRQLVLHLRSPAPDPAAILQLSTRTVQRTENYERATMQSDIVLPHWNGAAVDMLRHADGAILLTGATGFLGSYLLRSLLDFTNARIFAIVRCDDRPAGRARLIEVLSNTGMSPEQATSNIDTRVVVLPGDLVEPRLGLDEPVWDEVVGNVTDIYHCAADVDYIRPYRTLRPANVSGTCQLLELAAKRSGTSLHFISTTFIFGWTILDRLMESARNRTMKDIDFGYAQSKWAAEQLIHEAIRRGQNARIYRPSLVTASRRAHFISRDITARLLGYMIRHGVTVDLANQISFVPVDVCANNIVAISLLDDLKPNTFHITDDEHYGIAAVCSAITRHYGYAFDTVCTDTFLRHINTHCQEDDDLFPLRGFVNRNLPRIQRMKHKRYDNRNYRHARALSANYMAHPPLDTTVSAIVDFLRQEHLV